MQRVGLSMVINYDIYCFHKVTTISFYNENRYTFHWKDQPRIQTIIIIIE